MQQWKSVAENTRRWSAALGLPEYELDLSGCRDLVEVRGPVVVPLLNLRGCAALERLPDDLDVVSLDLSGCTALRSLPVLPPRLGRLSIAGCNRITELPSGLRSVARLDISGCTALRRLPVELSVTRALELSDTNVEFLPRLEPGAVVTWRGVHIQGWIATQPERICIDTILAERNVEVRRVLIERIGYEAFVRDSRVKVLHKDEDPGGVRRLLKVQVPDDEAVVCLAVQCPSTADRYFLRVPPDTRTCPQAAAWIAGFDDAADYQPVVET